MRVTRHQWKQPSTSAKPTSLTATGLRRNDTGGGQRAGSAGPTPPATKEGDDWPTAGGIPVFILWLPYTALTALLLGLMLASFIRFHRKRLRKFRSRKELLWRQLDVQEFLLEQRQEPFPPNGNLLPPAATILPISPAGVANDDRKHCRQVAGNGRRNTSLEAPYAHSDPQVSPARRSHARRQASTASRSSDRQVSRAEHWRTSDETRAKRLVPEVARNRLSRMRLPDAETENACRKRNSVVFITNINGSMVNLRCGEPDGLDPFHGRRCFWPAGDSRPSAACTPARTLVEPPCLRPPVAPPPAIWTTAFNYDPDMENECRKTRYSKYYE